MALKMWPSLVVPRRTSGRAPLAAALAAALDEAALAALPHVQKFYPDAYVKYSGDYIVK